MRKNEINMRCVSRGMGGVGTYDDWTGNVIGQADLGSLDPGAVRALRAKYALRHPEQSGEVQVWDAAVFLSKAGVLKRGKVTVAAAILQGINRQYFTIFATSMGLLTKLALNVPLVYWLGGIGAGYATIAGYIVAIILMVWMIQRTLHFPYQQLLRRTILMFLMGGAMFAAVFLSLLVTMNDEASWGNDIFATITGVTIGVLVYGYLGWRSHLAGKLLGRRFEYRRKM